MFKVKVTILLLFVCSIEPIEAQSKPVYEIAGDTVIFNVDLRDYKKFTKDNTAKRIRLDDLEVDYVVVTGQFNNWSRDSFKMNKVDTYRYQLKKELSEFEDEFSWEFKFIVNGEYWAEPDKNFNNITESDVSVLFGKNYNFKMYTVNPDSNGNAHFYLKGFENANKVILSGTFNKWDEQHLKMKKVKGGWAISLQLKPDTYEYKFIVDGHWMEDPDNARKKYNEHFTFNSIVTIKKTVTFQLKGYENAKDVFLTGSFNNWNSTDLQMQKLDNVWQCKVDLSGGKYHYKFIVDGKWINDPDNSVKEHDAYGDINSVKMVN